MHAVPQGDEEADDSPNGRSPADAATTELSLPQKRDRIVVIGRRQAGKTIYTAVLYWLLWQNKHEIQMRAVQGRTHRICMEIVQTLREGRWPSATVGLSYLDFEITYNGRSRPLVMLDYPGEVFRRAFIDSATGPDVDELLNHIDRATAVILLVDAAAAASDNVVHRMDDDFGLLKAVERIRNRVGGEEVPFAIVLTKYDRNRELISREGGSGAFVRRHLGQVIRELDRVTVCKCSAVRQSEREGVVQPVFSDDNASVGVVEPLQVVLRSLAAVEERRDKERLREEIESMREATARFAEQREKRTVLWAVLVTLLAAGTSTAAALIWLARDGS